MILALAITSILLFILGLRLLRIIPVAGQALPMAREVGAQLRDPALDDEAKAKIAQRFSGRMLLLTWQISWRAIVVLAVPTGLLLAAEALGLAPAESVMTLTLSWPLLLFGVVAAWLILRGSTKA